MMGMHAPIRINIFLRVNTNKWSFRVIYLLTNSENMRSKLQHNTFMPNKVAHGVLRRGY